MNQTAVAFGRMGQPSVFKRHQDDEVVWRIQIPSNILLGWFDHIVRDYRMVKNSFLFSMVLLSAQVNAQQVTPKSDVPTYLKVHPDRQLALAIVEMQPSKR